MEVFHGEFLAVPHTQDVPAHSAAPDVGVLQDACIPLQQAVATLVKHMPRIQGSIRKLELVRGRANEFFALFLASEYYKSWCADKRSPSKRITPIGFAREMFTNLGM
jgi:hypothetical protein